jgi:hypothetical protein
MISIKSFLFVCDNVSKRLFDNPMARRIKLCGRHLILNRTLWALPQNSIFIQLWKLGILADEETSPDGKNQWEQLLLEKHSGQVLIRM